MGIEFAYLELRPPPEVLDHKTGETIMPLGTVAVESNEFKVLTLQSLFVVKVIVELSEQSNISRISATS